MVGSYENFDEFSKAVMWAATENNAAALSLLVSRVSTFDKGDTALIIAARRVTLW